MLGLLGQQVAYAAGMHMSAVPGPASEMSADCMEMMQKQQPKPAEQPCEGAALGCIAAMGCALPVVLKEPTISVVAPALAPALAFWPEAAVLVGDNLPPEQRPPAILG